MLATPPVQVKASWEPFTVLRKESFGETVQIWEREGDPLMRARLSTLGPDPSLRVMMGVLVAAALSALLFCIVLAPGAALALPEGRHYEMVSPVYKAGYGATRIEGVSEDGESVAFFSAGTFAGAPSGLNLNLGYLARRGASGWSTVPLSPPASLAPGRVGEGGDFDPSLSEVLSADKPGETNVHPFNEVDLLLRPTAMPDTSAAWELSGVLKPLSPGSPEIMPKYLSASTDFCQMLLRSNVDEALTNEGGEDSGAEELYDFARGCGGEPSSLALVGVNNDGKGENGRGQPIERGCYAALGGASYEGSGGRASFFNAVSADGGEVFFTTCTVPNPSEPYGANVPHQVFVRLGDSRTLEVSRPVEAGKTFGGCVGAGPEKVPGEVPCEGASARASAEFQGASQDGSAVYFTTSARLTPGDEDASGNLFLARIGCPEANPACAVGEREVTSVTQVSRDPAPAQAANVLGVVRVAPDGERVYFVATGVLTQAPSPDAQGYGPGGEPVATGAVAQPGADNLYAYDSSTGTVSFIGDLCSGAELSLTVADPHCANRFHADEALWNNAEDSQAQTAGPDGRFLVFSTYAGLLAGDTNPAKDVYRYDALSGRLDRVSGGESGFDANGNATVLNGGGEPLGASIEPGNHGSRLREEHEMDSRAVSEDGSRIVFASVEPLSPLAPAGVTSAYEWHQSASGGEGSVSLISGGGGIEGLEEGSGGSEGHVGHNLVISPSGNDVFFATAQGLVPQDTDGASDVYDARLGAGFSSPPVPAHQCSGDACQGPLTNPAPLLIPGSVLQAPGENVAPSAPVASVRKAAVKRKTKRAKRKKRKVRRARKSAVKRSSGRSGR